MTESIDFAKSISIREAGKDEYWLQNQIYDNPSCLGLGELETIEREKKQSSGGRLDLLLKDPEDDTMYEVEIMLGETDESHIIRTIEYWDNEKRRWPQRQHFAVLVAERINRRFFNVINLLSNTVPIIAIQASLVQIHGKQSLLFTKILDTYEEIDDGTGESNIKTTREDWAKKSKWTLETADYLLELFSNVFESASLNYVKYYISIVSSGNYYNYFWLRKRSNSKSLLVFRQKDTTRDKIKEILDANNISYNPESRKYFALTIDKKLVEQNKETFITLAKLVKENKN
jgi:hypothetical protein